MERKKNNIWYLETWDEEDLSDALFNAEVPVTKENIERLKGICRKKFNIIERHKMLLETARELFGKTDKNAEAKEQVLSVATPDGAIEARVTQNDGRPGIELCYVGESIDAPMVIMEYDPSTKAIGLNLAGVTGKSAQKMSVETPKGPIEARISSDPDYPGIELYFAEPKSGEPGVVMEYSPTYEDITLRVYDFPHANDMPYVILSMTKDVAYEP